MDGGAWKAAVHGVAKSRTRLSDFTFTFHFHALEKEMAAHSSILAWRIPGTEEPVGLPSMGSQSRTRLPRLSSSSKGTSRPACQAGGAVAARLLFPRASAAAGGGAREPRAAPWVWRSGPGPHSRFSVRGPRFEGPPPQPPGSSSPQGGHPEHCVGGVSSVTTENIIRED